MSERKRKTWQEHVRLAPHYLEIGQTEVYLEREDMAPWELVTGVDTGGTHRLDICVSVVFRAKHPCGLTFRWYFDLEDRSANGSSLYSMRVKDIEALFDRLPVRARQSFKNILSDTAAAVALKAREWRQYADNQKAQADALARLAR